MGATSKRGGKLKKQIEWMRCLASLIQLGYCAHHLNPFGPFELLTRRAIFIGPRHGKLLRYAAASAALISIFGRLENQRRAFYAKVWEQQRKDLPLIYLWIGKNIVGMKKQLTGFQQVPDGLIRLQGMAMAP